MKKRLMFCALIFVFLVSFASASISINKVNEAYSLGDILYLTITTKPISVAGFFEVNLICQNNTLTIERFIANRFALGEEQTTSTNFPLTPDYINELLGTCNIVASVGGEEASTNAFLISNNIFLTTTLDKENYNPNEPITLKVNAVKANGDLLNGFLEISGATDSNRAVKSGIITFTFSMPQTTEAGSYDLNLFAYDSGEFPGVLNYANTTISFNINQVPSFIQTSLSDVEATPGENFEFGLDLYDQSGIQMTGIITITIVSPTGKETQSTANAGETTSITPATNATPGTWRIISKFEKIVEEKEFTMKSIQKVSFDFLDSILVVKNIGNAVYNKTIEIKIGEETQKLENLNIKVGEKRKFNLRAPNGEYNVVVTDNDDSVERTLLLTGKAVSIDNLKDWKLFGSYSLLWTFIIIILFAIVAIIFIRFRHKTKRLRDKIRFPFFSRKKKLSRLNEDSTDLKENKKQILDLSKQEIGKAESSLVLKGEKNKSTIISLKILNPEELTKQTEQELEKILEITKDKKGVVESKGNYVMVVFSPLITKTFKNEILAVKTGFKILENLKNHNKKFKDKIQFNIGIHTGDLIASFENKKLKYTGIGNTIVLAKRISDYDENKLLISQDVKNKLLRDLKVKKATTIGKTEVYEVEKVTDREGNKEKLQDLLSRMKREEKR